MSDQTSGKPSLFMFWGCFIALITTAFAFITRAFLVNTPELWPTDFALDEVQRQNLFGAGIWPFAISIILFSLVIDKIGYRVAMIFSFVCYAAYAALALLAHATVNATGLEGEALIAARALGLKYLTAGSIILGLGNGTVEAFINPVVATMFNKDKTKWLNILHAGWPGGLVLGGLITIGLGDYAVQDWRLLVYIIALPALVYLVMLLGASFPVSERVAAGATYREMLAEFGAIGAAIALLLVFMQLVKVYNDSIAVDPAAHLSMNYAYIAVAIATVAYGIYCRSFGRPLLIFLILIMMPLATTELGTDGAITGIMEKPMKAANYNPLWVLIYTSAIMMVLRFFAGPVVKALTPLGLLATCAALAIGGLYWLSFAEGLVIIFAAATLYGVAKTYFWPTMLGVVAEQFPKGGALTLNAIAGIGMLTVGVVGGPLIGKMQEDSAKVAVQTQLPGVYETISTDSKDPVLGEYTAVNADKIKDLKANAPEKAEELAQVVESSKQSALAKVTMFPAFMLVCYIVLIFYFNSKGGYKPVDARASGH